MWLIIGVLLYFVLLMYMVAKNGKAVNDRLEKQKNCKLHKWTLKKQPGTDNNIYYQVCEKCGKIPGLEDDGAEL